MSTVRIGGGHRLRKQLFVRGLRQGWLDVDEVEDCIPTGTLSASERWLLYFSLRAAEVELRDSDGRVVTPDEVVPRGRSAARRPIELEEDVESEEDDEPSAERDADVRE